MTAEEVLQKLHQYAWTGCEPGLERVRALLFALGEPQKALKFVHIAGSNGKGSSSAMLASVLRAAGYRTGLFTSPHLVRMNERMQVDGVEITDAELSELAELVLARCRGLAVHPTEYELMCAIGMEFFRRRGCDIVVLEVGLGGRLDATNVIDAPEAAALTTITMEHTNILGNSLDAIIWEKVGVVKPGSHAVLYAQSAKVVDKVSEVCRGLAVPLTVTAPEELILRRRDIHLQEFTYRGEDSAISLAGGHQLQNAALVLDIVAALRARGWEISASALKAGLRAAKWPGRLELLCERPVFFVDGGHNPQCAEALMAALKELFGEEKKFTVLVGVHADKDWESMLRAALPRAGRFITVANENPRALGAETLAAWLREQGAEAVAAPSVYEGAVLARDSAADDEVICAWGSLYNVGTIRAAVGGAS